MLLIYKKAYLESDSSVPGARVSADCEEGLEALASTRHEQVRIKRLADLAIERFNTGCSNVQLIAVFKKED